MDNTYKKQNNIIYALKYAFIFVAILWIIQLFQLVGLDFHTLGILPRSKDGLIGIITSPLIHGNFQHLIANTIPLFILLFLLFLSQRKNAIFFTILIWITTGILTWIIGRNAWHIGASGLIYGLASFLVVGGILSKNWKLIIVSVLVAVLYYGIIWGIFPTETAVSWEGHLAGAISGVLWAFAMKKKLRADNK